MPEETSRLASVLVLLLSAFDVGAANAQQSRTLGDGELEPLAASLSAYFEARTADAGVESAAAAVAQRA